MTSLTQSPTQEQTTPDNPGQPQPPDSDGLFTAWLDSVGWDAQRITSALMSIDEADDVFVRMVNAYSALDEQVTP